MGGFGGQLGQIVAGLIPPAAHFQPQRHHAAGDILTDQDLVLPFFPVSLEERHCTALILDAVEGKFLQSVDAFPGKVDLSPGAGKNIRRIQGEALFCKLQLALVSTADDQDQGNSPSFFIS